MKLFTNEMKELKRPDEPLFKTPKIVQQTLDIQKVSENGIFQLSSTRYSKTYKFKDINYITSNHEEREDIIEEYCKLLNTFDCRFKVTIANENKDMDELEEMVLLPNIGDEFQHLRDIYNGIIMEKISEGSQGIERERYLTITIERKTYEEAKARFATIEATIRRSFAELGSELIDLTGNDRLKSIYGFYHLGEEADFDLDIKQGKKMAKDVKNDLINGSITFYPDHMIQSGKYCRALFIKKYPSSMSDRFLGELTSLPVHSMTSIDVVPIPKDLTTKMLQKKYLGVENDIIKQQRVRNKNNDFASDISYLKRVEKKEIASMMDDVRENDECMFYVGVTMIITCDTKEELESVTETIIAIGKQNSVTIDTHNLMQRQALATVLPIGNRQVKTMRTLLTQPLAAMLPFNVQELSDKNGIYYGINQVSKNIIIANRKIYLNGNGFIFGVPGGGKSMFAKGEMGQVFLGTNDDIIVIDPMNEYFDVAHAYGGTIVNLSAYTKSYVNPLAVDLYNIDQAGLHEVIAEKSQFLLSLCDQLLGGSFNRKHQSIVDRCTKELYFTAYRTKQVPLMSDFYNVLKRQPESEAKELALSLELFVEGSLNIFNHHTNVDVDNRFTVYGIQELGDQLAPVAMLVMMEAIQSRIIENGKKGRATWLYIDECHVLLKSDYSAAYLQQLWKKVRKQGGLCTGISQNVTDLLQNDIAATLISNSEFIVLLKQSNIDSVRLAETIGVTDAQLEFVKNSQSGTGLIKCGTTIVPFDDRISKDCELYDLYNTNIHEKIRKNQIGGFAPNPAPQSKPSGGWLIKS